MPLVASGSASSDLFEPDDPDFIEALQTVVLPGDVLEPSQVKVDGQNNNQGQPFEPQNTVKRAHSQTSNQNHASDGDLDTYGASRFGEFGEYMRRKRAKLQIQNAQLDQPDEGSSSSRLFQSVAIYINGWTEPSVQDLRQLVIKHGGTFHAYLDKKALVTHIITCSLTPTKIREFKHIKVVRPEWLVESAKAGELLPWQNFIFQPGGRLDASQGQRVQQSLTGFVSQGYQQIPKGHSQTPESCHRPTPSIEDMPIDESSSEEIEAPPSTQPRVKASTTPPKNNNSSSIPPIYTTDPATTAQAALVPGYATHESNPLASRAMANSEWRSAHTSVAPDFIEGFYRNSRLHHLSAWKAELKDLVAIAQERVENGIADTASRSTDGIEAAVDKIVLENASGMGPRTSAGTISMKGAELVSKSPSKWKGKQKENAIDEDLKVIMHCDFDCFFVSAGLVSRPHLLGKPVVVCHSQGTQGGQSSTSEIASASYEARKFGIKNGMSLQQARKLCPTVMTMPYEFERYKQFSLQFYTILMSHADDLQAVSVDEALIDVTSSVRRISSEASQNPSGSLADPAKVFAEAIRTQVKKATGCEVSIGIGHNILLARLATRRAKPAGSYHLLPANVPEFIAPLDISDLHGFGWSTHQKAQVKLGVTKLGELAQKSKAALYEALGKGTGEILYKAIRGIDDRKLESDKQRKSVSCDINYGIRFENNDQARTFICQMADEVSRRLNSIDVGGRSLTVKIMKRDPAAPIEPPKFLGHGACEVFNKQTPFAGPSGRATSDDKVIGECAWKLLKSFNFDPKELRGIGIQIQKLEFSSAAVNPALGQAQLPFRPIQSSTDDGLNASNDDVGQQCPKILVQPPSQDDLHVGDDTNNGPIAGPSTITPTFDLPSFSQLDKSVLYALPTDVREELEAEYKRRSHSPALAESVRTGSAALRSRSSEPSGRAWPQRGAANVKRITQQLAPRSRSSISPRKRSIFSKRTFGTSGIHVSEAELRRLDIDPDVFAALPLNMQREQLSMARAERAPGGPNVIIAETRKVIKPYYRPSRSPSAAYRRLPPPQANHPPPPFLKQQGKEKGEKLYFTETEDVQNVIERWVDGFRECLPNQKDVDFFGKWLVQCVDGNKSTDMGVEKAVAVVKWWLVLLRRYWGVWETDCSEEEEAEVGKDNNGRVTSEDVGKAWWKAFRGIKEKMNVAARQKFGGSLSFK